MVVGVSGGADSISLIHILSALKKELNLGLTAVYIDHGLRPDEVPAEIELIQSTAARLEISAEVIPVDVRGYADNNKLSLEHAARDLRYGCFRAVAKRTGATAIAVAHNADDQAEQVLLGLFRGSGMKGLAGMRYRNEDIIRPLLNVSKKQLKKFLAANKFFYCDDSSNDDLSFLRNRIRHKLFPYLIKYFDRGIKKSLLKSAAIFSEDELLLSELTEQAWKDHVGFDCSGELPVITINRSDVNSLHVAIKRRLVEKILWKIGSRASYEHILQVVKVLHHNTSGKELHLKQGLRVVVGKQTVTFLYPQGRRAWRGSLASKNKF